MTDWDRLEAQAKEIDYTRSPAAIAMVVHAMAGMDGDIAGLRERLEQALDREPQALLSELKLDVTEARRFGETRELESQSA